MAYHRWTDADFATLRAMTDFGYTAAQIAEAIGSTEGSVAVRRTKGGTYAAPSECRYCDKPLEAKGRGRRPTFCDVLCREAHTAERERQARLEARADLACEACGGEIPLESIRRRYCSRECSQRAWYERAKQDPDFAQRRLEAVRRHQNRVRSRKNVQDDAAFRS